MTSEPFVDAFQNKVRSAPITTTVGGFAAGLVLSRLPVFGIIVLLLRLALGLVRPALLVLGVMKTVEFVQSRQAATENAPLDI